MHAAMKVEKRGYKAGEKLKSKEPKNEEELKTRAVRRGRCIRKRWTGSLS